MIKKLNIFIFLTAFLAAIPLSAANPRGMTFLRMNSFARSEGMAGAFTAVAEGPDGLFFNPAGLPASEQDTLSVHASYLNWTAETNKQSAVIVIPYQLAEKYFYINSLCIDYFSVPGLTKYDDSGNDIGDILYNDIAVSFNLGKRRNDLSYGANVKILRENIDTYTGSGFAIDAGMLYEISSMWRTGISFTNIGFFNLDPVQMRLPAAFRAGVAVANTERTYLLAIDYENYNSKAIIHLGAELARNGYLLRGGWRNTQDTGEYTFGIGVDSSENYLINWNVQVYINYSYTFAPYFSEENIQRLDVGVKY